MIEPEILKSQDVTNTLLDAICSSSVGTLSFLSNGKWRQVEVVCKTLTGKCLHIEIAPDDKEQNIDFRIDQPVGMSIQKEFDKFIFDSTVVGVECFQGQSVGGRVALRIPDKIEKMQRRGYERATVPMGLHVKVVFWHRGYSDDSREVPLDNYWEGKLVNLSAGGAQIHIDHQQEPNFRNGQLVGLQFTPMCYQKPILVEGQIKHLAKSFSDNKLQLGIEFLGLEADSEGRTKLHQILTVVEKYKEQSKTPDPLVTSEN